MKALETQSGALDVTFTRNFGGDPRAAETLAGREAFRILVYRPIDEAGTHRSKRMKNAVSAVGILVIHGEEDVKAGNAQTSVVVAVFSRRPIVGRIRQAALGNRLCF